MILQQLTVRNFCLFRGEQVFTLTPGRRSGKHLPIILFGGINGGGKTTLLDAIQLALYGGRARCSKRTNLSYDDFLRESIHHGVNGGERAGVELSFQHTADGEDHLFDVRRTWTVTDGRVREELRVYQDGLHDPWLSDHWPQLVEDLLPLDISQLFFFDAEKIRSLAEDESSSKALGAAIKSLLGLDIVERLITDSTVLPALMLLLIVLPLGCGCVETWRWLDKKRATRDRMERLEQQAAVARERLRVLDVVVRELAAGRISLLQAAAWEREVSSPSSRGAAFRQGPMGQALSSRRGALRTMIKKVRGEYEVRGRAAMPPQQDQTPPPVMCSLLVLVATPTEEKGLRQAAAALNLPCERIKAKNSALQVEYYDLGPVGAETRVIALPPARTDDNELVMGSMGFFGTAARAMRLRVATGAQSIIQVGMAFGIDPERQKIGDVLVSTSLVPYDNRIVKPLVRECSKCGEPAEWFTTDYTGVTREQARPSLVRLFRREQLRREQAGKDDFRVYLGAMLSGAGRIHCRCYRDEVAKRVPPGEDLIIGGEMEGVGLLAASVAWGDPIWCVVKGICDFADEGRDAVIKEAREGACRNAASFVLASLVNDVAG